MPFLSPTKVPQLMREAHRKGALKLGKYKGGYIFATDRVISWSREKEIDGKIMAAIVELLGFSPLDDTLYIVKKGDDVVPLDEEGKNKVLALLDLNFTGVHFRESPVSVIDRGYHTRLLQNPEKNNIVGTLQKHLDLLDKNRVDYNIEGDPTGPFGNPDLTHVYYTTSTTVIGFVTFHYEKKCNKDVVNMLTMVDMVHDLDLGGAF